MIWMWPPFRRLERGPDDAVGRGAKLLWLALYTSPEAKQSVPGLFAGSINTMAESIGSPPDEVRRCLDRLIEDDLVEIDVPNRVLRMTVLPDSGESPTNGNTIRGWWRKFQNVPPCAVRDAHVPILLWIMQEWSRANNKAISADHMKAWAETFGRVSVPAARPRPKRHQQTSLFLASSSASDPDLNEISNSETLSKPFRKERDQDPDRDQDQGSGSGAGGDSASGKKPVLLLVPHPAFDADDLAEALWKASGGGFPQALTREQRVALGRAIDSIGDIALHPAALASLGEYVASLTQLRGGAGLGVVSFDVVVSPGWLAAAIKRGMEWTIAGSGAAAEAPA